MNPPAPPSAARISVLAFVPLLILGMLVIMTNAGVSATPSAKAATDTVTVTATVGSALAVADQCSGAYAITVALGTYSDGTPCAVQFGATNIASVSLRVAASTNPFLSPANFANEGATCANLGTVDEVGLKLVSVVAPTTNTWTCALGADDNNSTAAHKGLTTTAQPMCNSAALGVTNTCTFAIGIWEAGSNAPPGAYTGTVNLSVI
jgi:hypothetical protein